MSRLSQSAQRARASSAASVRRAPRRPAEPGTSQHMAEVARLAENFLELYDDLGHEVFTAALVDMRDYLAERKRDAHLSHLTK